MAAFCLNRSRRPEKYLTRTRGKSRLRISGALPIVPDAAREIIEWRPGRPCAAARHGVHA
ncbi:hypothetical protein STHU_27950 [Allostella humosa]|nr:hypothetical protein STHU_27950 [Stella humosa]